MFVGHIGPVVPIPQMFLTQPGERVPIARRCPQAVAESERRFAPAFAFGDGRFEELRIAEFGLRILGSVTFVKQLARQQKFYD